MQEHRRFPRSLGSAELDHSGVVFRQLGFRCGSYNFKPLDIG
jgi:hypothetical protein